MFLGSTGHNGFRLRRWIYSRDDFGDPVVASLKTEQRCFIRRVVTVFFSYIIMMPVLVGL